jgi:NitT/TauT family transport system ATP-binding protein
MVGAVQPLYDARVAAGAADLKRGRIEASAVSMSYDSRGGRVQALSNISVDIVAGSFVSVVGRSGSGKSTLLRLFAGLLRPTEGVVSIDSLPPAGSVPTARYVFQDYSQSLLPWQTVADNVAFGLRHSLAPEKDEDRRSAVGRYLAAVGLEDTGSRYPWELSGGMQQRVAIARALASKPDILLMDEPFSAVDALSRAQLQDLMLDIWSDTCLTVVLVTHDIEEAIYLSDRVIVLGPSGRGVNADLDIKLPRPREQVETREQHDYLSLRRELHGLVLA